MASSKRIRGLLVEIGGDTSKLETALKSVDKTTSSLSKELRGINTLLKFDPNNTELLNQKTKVLSQSIEETEKRLVALQQAQKNIDGSEIDKNSADYRDLQREIIVTQNKLSDLKNEASNWTKAGKEIEEFGNKVGNVSERLSNIGNKLTTGLTLPIVGLGVYAAKSAIEFESAFAGVEKTVDGTTEQMNQLKKGIKDMAQEIPASTTEISAVAEAAGQLGIETDNILDFTKVMIGLGNATNMSSDQAATSLARFANIAGTSQKDFDKLGSTIVDLRK